MPCLIPAREKFRWRWFCALFLVILVEVWPAAGGDSATELEYKVKAGYLVNFARYVEWPRFAEAPPDSPFVIGIIDNGEAHAVMQKVLDGKTIDKHPIRLLFLDAVPTNQAVRILMVTRAAGKTAEEIASAVGSAPVLVVGDNEKFAERGGMVGFHIEEGNIRITLNLERAAQAGLKISSKLSSVARLVKTSSAPRPR